MNNYIQKVQHLAVIMDGNGRWATQKGLSRSAGHKKGVDAVANLVDGVLERGIKYLTLFCFSIENWSRPKGEVDDLLDMLNRFLDEEPEKYRSKKINLSFIGQLARLPKNLQQKIKNIEQENIPQSDEKLRVMFALSYSGKSELVDAIKKIVKSGIDADSITENTVRENLYLPNIPDPDLLIRTSGEQRISNFLLWQLAYSEFVFLPKMWPDFEKKDLEEALDIFNKRQRRFGKV